MLDKPLKYGLFLLGITTAINLFVIVIFSFAWENLTQFSFLKILFFILASFISAFIISAAIIFTAPVMKDYLATYRRLLRLESLTHPLLLKLSMEAPGTYHHSLTVANIAYKAAKAINADSLLTRIGAYYHDVGKIPNSTFFIENQNNEQKNIHEQIDNPAQSANIIIQHVQDGIELAKEYKLPSEVVAFISEHHGTSQIRYFLELAKKMGLKPSEKDFTYPGPKPLSPETAIVMLADSIEAKTRSLDKINAQKIQKTVYDIVQEKINEHQLELSGLSQNKLELVCQSFIETLATMHHQRIKYPKKEGYNVANYFKHQFNQNASKNSESNEYRTINHQ